LNGFNPRRNAQPIHGPIATLSSPSSVCGPRCVPPTGVPGPAGALCSCSREDLEPGPTCLIAWPAMWWPVQQELSARRIGIRGWCPIATWPAGGASRSESGALRVHWFEITSSGCSGANRTRCQTVQPTTARLEATNHLQRRLREPSLRPRAAVSSALGHLQRRHQNHRLERFLDNTAPTNCAAVTHCAWRPATRCVLSPVGWPGRLFLRSVIPGSVIFQKRLAPRTGTVREKPVISTAAWSIISGAGFLTSTIKSLRAQSETRSGIGSLSDAYPAQQRRAIQLSAGSSPDRSRFCSRPRGQW